MAPLQGANTGSQFSSKPVAAISFTLKLMPVIGVYSYLSKYA